MDVAFHLAAIPEPVTVLGVRLKPFSLGHQLLLERAESPFVTGGNFAFGDLLAAVSICSRDYDSALEWLDGGNRLALCWWGLKVWAGVKLGSANLARALLTFQKYIAAGSTCPMLLTEESARHRHLEAPLVALVLSSMVKRGHSFKDSVNTPYGLSLWFYCIACASEGGAEIVGKEWREEVAALSVSSAEEINRMISTHQRLTRKN